jgi:DUF3037 family protein
MAQLSRPTEVKACLYSVVRAVPRPLRDESINLGVIVLASDGSYADARFAGWGRVRKLAPDADIKSMELFLNGIRSLLPMHGEQHHLLGGGQSRLSKELLSEWSRDFAGSVRISPPRAGLTTNPPELLLTLYRDLVDMRAALRPVEAKRPVSRRDLLRQLDEAAANWNLERAAIQQNATVHGRRATHFVDRAFLLEQSRIAAVLQALSFEVAELSDIYAHRATIIVAAEDLHEAHETANLPIFALYSPANSDRLSAVEESAALFQVRRVTPVQVRDLRQVQEVVESRLAFRG